MSCFHIMLAILNVAAFAPAHDVDFRFQVIGCVYPLPSPLSIFLLCEVQCMAINARYHEYQMAMMTQLSDHATQADLHVSEFCWVSGTWQWARRCHLTRSSEPVCGRPQAETFLHSVYWDDVFCILSLDCLLCQAPIFHTTSLGQSAYQLCTDHSQSWLWGHPSHGIISFCWWHCYFPSHSKKFPSWLLLPLFVFSVELIDVRTLTN